MKHHHLMHYFFILSVYFLHVKFTLQLLYKTNSNTHIISRGEDSVRQVVKGEVGVFVHFDERHVAVILVYTPHSEHQSDD